MKKIILFTILLLSFKSNAQLFIDNGTDGSLNITDASGGTLTTLEATATNVALYVDGNITNEGTLVNTAAEVQLTGNFANTGTFTTTGDEVFTGNATQVVSGSLTGSNDFYNLIINKNAGTLVQLGANIELDNAGILNLNQGLIQTTGLYNVYVKNSNSAAIINAGVNGTLDKFIEGELWREVVPNVEYSFPVGGTHVDAGGGDGVQYASINSNAGSGVIAVSFDDADGIGVADVQVICPTGVGDERDTEFLINNGTWDITNPTSSITDYNVTLSPIDFTTNSYTDYTILKDGITTGRDKCDGIATIPPLTHDSLTSFSTFAVAASTTTNLLPVELLSFNAKSEDNKIVMLNWQTATEINNDFFTIQRSKDGLENWTDLAIVSGAGNSSSVFSYKSQDTEPLVGISYYRLKQTDFDGLFTYSYIRSVNLNRKGNNSLEIYPNPAKNVITVKGNQLNKDDIKFYNVLGQDITFATKHISTNEVQHTIDLSKLSKGVYYLKTNNTSTKIQKK